MTPRHQPLAQRLTFLAAALCLAGCSQLQPYQRPDTALPTQWPMGAATPSPDRVPDWRAFVQDAPLRGWIDKALAHQHDLRVAVLQIEQARAQFDVRRADQWPTVNAAAAAERNTSGAGSSLYTVGLAVSGWEVDLFGRVASLKEAALAQYLAAEDTRQAVQISLVASVATAWLNARASGELLALAQKTLQTREASLRLTDLRYQQGVASALEWRQAQTLVEAARVAQAQQARQRLLDLNTLSLLTGAPTPVLAFSLDAQLGQPLQAFAPVAAGLPSDVLLGRPDIRASERALVAANAQVGAARAAFFPRLSLTASAGTASTSLSGLFSNGSWGWTLAPQLVLPVFDAGRNQANLDAADAARSIATVRYDQAVQTAFKEVADALAGQATLDDLVRAQAASVTAETDRLRLATLRTQQGVAGDLESLDAQRSLFAAQQALLQAHWSQALNQVALYKALGGGWDTAAPHGGAAGAAATTGVTGVAKQP